MAKIGTINTLPILYGTAHGAYLDGGELGEILLPRGQVPENLMPGESVDVFIHHDSEDRIIATTQRPLATLGKFASLRVTSWVKGLGAFLDWGLSKDLMLPLREQSQPIRPGEDVVVCVCQDERTGRLHASMRLDAYFHEDTPDLANGDGVELLIARETPLGFVCVVDGKWQGMIYHADVRDRVRLGEIRKGYVHQVRRDGRVDATLDSSGYARVTELTQHLLDVLADHDGHLDLDDDSPPERIRDVLGASKKAFKQALGALLRQGKVQLTRPGIELVKR